MMMTRRTMMMVVHLLLRCHLRFLSPDSEGRRGTRKQKERRERGWKWTPNW